MSKSSEPIDVEVVAQIKQFLRYSRNLNVYNDLEIKQSESGHLIEAHIRPEDWKIFISYQLHIKVKIESLIQKYHLGRIYSPASTLEYLVEAVCDHERAHSKICPSDVEKYAHLILGINDACSAEEDPNLKEKIRANRFLINNMIADIICNAILGLEEELNPVPTHFRHGQTFFYLGEGDLAVTSSDLKCFTPMYTIFCGTVMALFQEDPAMKELIAQFYHPSLESKIREGIRIFIGSSSIPHGNTKQIIEILNTLEDPSTWYTFAAEFVQLIKPYLPDHPENEPNYIERSPSGSGGNAKEYMGKVLRYLIRSGKTPKGSQGREKYGFNFQGIILPEEYQDELYLEKAKELNMVIVSKTMVEELKIVPARRVEWDGKSPLVNWDPFYTIVLPGGKFQLYLNDIYLPLQHRISGDGDIPVLPDICFLYDTSGSMQGEKYDLLLLGIYGALDMINRSGNATRIKYQFAAFTESTITSGWVSFYQLREARQKYLL